MKQMRQSEGEGELQEKTKDPQLPGLRFKAEGGTSLLPAAGSATGAPAGPPAQAAAQAACTASASST